MGAAVELFPHPFPISVPLKVCSLLLPGFFDDHHVLDIAIPTVVVTVARLWLWHCQQMGGVQWEFGWVGTG